MQEDLTPYLEQIAPWDYSIKIGDRVYATTCPTVGDVIIIEDLEATKKATVRQLRTVLERLFAGTKPPIDTWEFRFMAKVLGCIFAYWKTTLIDLKKNAAEATPSGPPSAAGK